MPLSDRTTRWSLVARAGTRDAAGQRALGELFSIYWPAVYAFYRREGESPDTAADLTQGLIVDLLERETLQTADPARGRFRAFLRTCARNFRTNERARDTRQKRGGKTPTMSLNFAHEEREFRTEPIDTLDPEAVFERRWARAVIDTALGRLEREETESGRGRLFTILRPTLEGQSLHRPYAQVAAELGISEGAFKVTAHRLKGRFRAAILQEVGHTLADDGSAGEELELLLAALQSR